jgi:hypothetical protein
MRTVGCEAEVDSGEIPEAVPILFFWPGGNLARYARKCNPASNLQVIAPGPGGERTSKMGGSRRSDTGQPSVTRRTECSERSVL